jgi:hypothetical protein
MPLTIFQAEAEARWRWSGLTVRAFARYTGKPRRPFQVGTKRFGVTTIRGEGESWEGAFSDADRRTNAR